METNEAPEKLYLSDIQRYFDDRDKTISTIKYADDDIEYTRTDAFIEKALDYIENNIYDYYDGDHEYGVCGGYVKKEEFIERFKNYLKGELLWQ